MKGPYLLWQRIITYPPTYSDRMSHDHPPASRIEPPEPAAEQDKSNLERGVARVAQDVSRAEEAFCNIKAVLTTMKDGTSFRGGVIVYWRPAQHSALKDYRGKWVKYHKVRHVFQLYT